MAKMATGRRDDLDAQARRILHANDRGGYTVPNPHVYPFQWNWDSAFVALGWQEIDSHRAWRELQTLFAAQWEDGFLPHIVFWQQDPGYFPGPDVWRVKRAPATSGITQPPVAASVVRWMWERQGSAADMVVADLYPRLLAWHRWFRRARDPEGFGLPLIIHPWESGRDNSVEWDAPGEAVDTSAIEPYERRDITKLEHGMRPTKRDYDRYLALLQFGRDKGWDQRVIAAEGPFRVIDFGLAAIFLRAERDLAVIAERLGRTEEAAETRSSVARAETAMQRLWQEDPGAFCSLDLRTGAPVRVITNASFLAFYAGIGNARQRGRLIAHLEDIAAHCRFVVPSLDPRHEAFDPLRYWRGPVWAVVNFLIARGLEETGYGRWAERIRLDTASLIRKTGFFEAFSPIDGAASGGADFSWTAAIWLAWAGRTPEHRQDAARASRQADGA
ncbi:MAG: hypothetical protein KatS3mg119_2190 [Rhodothalassiaceae bacterium]|nr:MAG: hypothetical protein KatS3mg119_2190 [Rhodothalassiaceae bacterium]